jgi:hypothetical protein
VFEGVGSSRPTTSTTVANFALPHFDSRDAYQFVNEADGGEGPAGGAQEPHTNRGDVMQRSSAAIRLTLLALLNTSGIAGLSLSPVPAASAAEPVYALTVFVDEGHGKLNGHVFLGLTSGNRTGYRGFYPSIHALGVASLGAGEIRDDARLARNGWDVQKTFVVSRDSYDDALDLISHWNARGRAWGLRNHCGDFAETIVRAARIDIDLPAGLTGRNRPGLWGEALRVRGAVVNEERARR